MVFNMVSVLLFQSGKILVAVIKLLEALGKKLVTNLVMLPNLHIQLFLVNI